MLYNKLFGIKTPNPSRFYQIISCMWLSGWQSQLADIKTVTLLREMRDTFFDYWLTVKYIPSSRFINFEIDTFFRRTMIFLFGILVQIVNSAQDELCHIKDIYSETPFYFGGAYGGSLKYLEYNGDSYGWKLWKL